MDIWQIALEQLATDFGTLPDALGLGHNLFTLRRHDSRRRPYEERAPLNVLCMGGICAFCSADAALRDALRREYADCGGDWFLELDSLRRLDGVLAPFGMRAQSYHQYYLPGRNRRPARPALEVQWYEGEALLRFEGDGRFDEALAGDPACPDQLAVTALIGGSIAGMAAASRDSERLWQIGVNVDAAARGRGIATGLVALLTDELIARGIVPFYGTAASHILSQRVAVAAGYVPAWAELSADRA